MKYTAKEVFDEANDAISSCPQAGPFDIDQMIRDGNTFEDIIRNEDVVTMLEIFGANRTLFHSGYWRCLPADLCRDMRIAAAERDIRIAISNAELTESTT